AIRAQAILNHYWSEIPEKRKACGPEDPQAFCYHHGLSTGRQLLSNHKQHAIAPAEHLREELLVSNRRHHLIFTRNGRLQDVSILVRSGRQVATAEDHLLVVELDIIEEPPAPITIRHIITPLGTRTRSAGSDSQ